MEQTLYDFLYLVGCAIRMQPPLAERVSRMDLDEIWRTAEWQKMGATVACAVALMDDPEAAVGKKRWAVWAEAMDKALRRTLLHATEREALAAFCERNGIRYLPLKGVLLEQMYPQLGMREMADNDILYDTAYRKEIQHFFQERGYSVEKSPVHDQYTKPPMYNFEMHAVLFDSERGVWDTFFSNAFLHAERDRAEGFGYHFPDNFFYVYVVAHAYRHYAEGGGTGMRILSDIFVMRQHLTLDWTTVERDMALLGLQDFEATVSSLSKRLFSNPERIGAEPLSSQEEELLETMLYTGSYGIHEQRVKSSLKNAGINPEKLSFGQKLQFLLRRAFPDYAYMKRYFPIVKKAPILLPFVHVYRWIRGIFHRQDRIKGDFDAMKKL